MVRNDYRSLRGSNSTLSLRSSAEEASRQRIAELEAQLAALTAQDPPTTPFTLGGQSDREAQSIRQSYRTLYEEAEAQRQRPARANGEGQRSLFEGFHQPVSREREHRKDTPIEPAAYTKPFLEFMTDHPTVWHAVSGFAEQLLNAGFKKVCDIPTRMKAFLNLAAVREEDVER